MVRKECVRVREYQREREREREKERERDKECQCEYDCTRLKSLGIIVVFSASENFCQNLWVP